MLSERALQRRLKRKFLKAEQEYLAVCTPGVEQVLAQELQLLDTRISLSRIVPGGVEFFGPLDAIYSTNLYLTTANRILLRISTFPAPTTPQLFSLAKRIRWEHYVGFSSSIKISVTTRGSSLNHKTKIADVVGSAIRDRLAGFGLAPKIGLIPQNGLEILVRFLNNNCTISLNTSGIHLHKRGWRRFSSIAPLRETLAAAILKMSRLSESDLLVDPFCGAGTFLIEGARLLSGFPAGGQRAFAFENTPFHNQNKWSRLRSRALRGRSATNTSFIGGDIDGAIIKKAQANAVEAGVSASTEMFMCDATLFPYRQVAEHCSHPLLVTNLPYGRRISSRQAVRRTVTSFIKQINNQCNGWKVSIITADKELLQPLRLAESSVKRLDNGGIRVFLVTGVVGVT